MHSVSKQMSHLESFMKIWLKIDLYFQRQRL